VAGLKTELGFGLAKTDTLALLEKPIPERFPGDETEQSRYQYLDNQEVSRTKGLGPPAPGTRFLSSMEMLSL
jgi:hypothetical protein